MRVIRILVAVAIVMVPISTAQAKPKDIVDLAAGAGHFETLVTAIRAAGLVETLKGDGPFTVFAPTDAAFAKIPEGTVESLLKPENKEKLVAILTYHVVLGRLNSWNVVGTSTSVKTVQGDMLAVDATDGVKVDDATVIAPDIPASNGVIHFIDKVVMPE